MAVTEATARALREIQPGDADPAVPVFGLTGEALANRVRAAVRASEKVSLDTAAASAWPGEWSRRGRPTAAVQHQGRWKHGDMVAYYTRGEAAREALKWLT